MTIKSISFSVSSLVSCAANDKASDSPLVARSAGTRVGGGADSSDCNLCSTPGVTITHAAQFGAPLELFPSLVADLTAWSVDCGHLFQHDLICHLSPRRSLWFLVHEDTPSVSWQCYGFSLLSWCLWWQSWLEWVSRAPLRPNPLSLSTFSVLGSFPWQLKVCLMMVVSHSLLPHHFHHQ